MAYVRKTQTLLEDVANKVDRMMREQLADLPERKDPENGTPLYDELAGKVMSDIWKEAPELRGKLPDDWYTSVSSVRFKLVLPEDEQHTVRHNTMSFDLNSSTPFQCPPRYDGYWADATVINREELSAESQKWYDSQVDIEVTREDLRRQYVKVKRQVVRFLDNSASLNAALKEMPEIKAYIPEHYLSRVAEKVVREKQVAVKVKDALKIDKDAIAGLSVAHRISQAGR